MLFGFSVQRSGQHGRRSSTANEHSPETLHRFSGLQKCSADQFGFGSESVVYIQVTADELKPFKLKPELLKVRVSRIALSPSSSS